MVRTCFRKHQSLEWPPEGGGACSFPLSCALFSSFLSFSKNKVNHCFEHPIIACLEDARANARGASSREPDLGLATKIPGNGPQIFPEFLPKLFKNLRSPKILLAPGDPWWNFCGFGTWKFFTPGSKWASSVDPKLFPMVFLMRLCDSRGCMRVGYSTVRISTSKIFLAKRRL